jgi:hypothetical protein
MTPSMMNWRAFTRRAFELTKVRRSDDFLTSQRNRLLHIINIHLGLPGI